MDVQKFERVCRTSKYQPLQKIWTSDGNILIAERHFKQGEDPDWRPAHWKVLWSIERDDMKEGQPLIMNDWYELRGLLRALTQDDRKIAAKACATQWMMDAKESRHYA